MTSDTSANETITLQQDDQIKTPDQPLNQNEQIKTADQPLKQSEPHLDDDDSGEDDDMKQAEDRQEKLKLLIEHLEPCCNEDSPYKELRAMGHALKHNNDKLKGIVLSGGYTNYSYKVYLEQDPDTAVFAKVAFPYALWSPDHSTHYDLNRQTAEFHLMRRFAKELAKSDDTGMVTSSPIPMPYELIDVPSHNVRIFVAEWVAPTDEQWGNQYIEGSVDRRIVTYCAETLAQINLADCDDDVNAGYTASFHEIGKGFDKIIMEILDRERTDRAVECARTIGRDRLASIIKAWHDADESLDCLVHGDAHVFNMLVERKPVGGMTSWDDMMNKFGEKGSFFLCDWEMAHKGHKGRDVGTFFSYPFMAAAFLAARGQIDRAKDVLDTLPQFWQDYSAVLSNKGGKDEEYIREVFLSAVAFHGYFLCLVFYLFGCFRELNDTEGLSEEQEKTVMGTVGFVGLKCLEMGLMDDLAAGKSLEELESFLFGSMNNELQDLSDTIGSSLRQRSRRRSSLLRASVRRVSDTVSGFGKIARRLSRISHAEITTDRSEEMV